MGFNKFDINQDLGRHNTYPFMNEISNEVHQFVTNIDDEEGDEKGDFIGTQNSYKSLLDMTTLNILHCLNSFYQYTSYCVIFKYIIWFYNYICTENDEIKNITKVNKTKV